MPTNLHVTWLDRCTASVYPPDPSYPAGTNLDLALDAAESCWTPLPYPATGVGAHVIACSICHLRGGLRSRRTRRRSPDGEVAVPISPAACACRVSGRVGWAWWRSAAGPWRCWLCTPGPPALGGSAELILRKRRRCSPPRRRCFLLRVALRSALPAIWSGSQPASKHGIETVRNPLGASRRTAHDGLMCITPPAHGEAVH
jgi:LSD1 subclass zinc finger protein